MGKDTKQRLHTARSAARTATGLNPRRFADLVSVVEGIASSPNRDGEIMRFSDLGQAGNVQTFMDALLRPEQNRRSKAIWDSTPPRERSDALEALYDEINDRVEEAQAQAWEAVAAEGQGKTVAEYRGAIERFLQEAAASHTSA